MLSRRIIQTNLAIFLSLFLSFLLSIVSVTACKTIQNAITKYQKLVEIYEFTNTNTRIVTWFTYKKINKTKQTHSAEEQALTDIQTKPNDYMSNARTTTVPTITTTTTLAATSKTRNCRGLIQKRAHTLDDFMEGNGKLKKETPDNIHWPTNTHKMMMNQRDEQNKQSFSFTIDWLC